MKVIQINSVCGIRSTGRICSETAQMLLDRGDECFVFFGRENMGTGCEKFGRKYGNFFTNIFHYFTQILCDDDGAGSYFTTKKMIRDIKKISPDIVHLHNLHGHYVNYSLLMNYLAKADISVVFSFYDCWMFTGNCTHFDYLDCDNWKTECKNCPNQNKYPFDKLWIDRSRHNYKKKIKSMAKIKQKCITPGSYWMEGLVRQSFLKDNDIITVQSGVDLTRFKPTYSDLREKYSLGESKIVLCVASHWKIMKGSNYLPELAEKLPKDYRLVVVGNTEKVNLCLPDTVIEIPATDSIEKLAEWYTVADVYVNLTLQETQGLTSIESLACGTPVVTFNTGGCPECVDESCGIVVERGDMSGILAGIIRVLEEAPFSKESCFAKAKKCDKNICYEKYIEIYDNFVKKKEMSKESIIYE